VPPAVLPALAILIGAALGTTTSGQATWPAVVLMAAAWGASVAGFAAGRTGAFVAAIAVTCFAGAWALAGDASRAASHPPLRLLAAEGGPPVVLEGRLVEDAVPGERGVALTVAVERVGVGAHARPASGGVRLTVGGDLAVARAERWRAGRLVRVPAALREPGRYRDPGVADGRLALARRGVALVGGVKSGALVEVLARGGALAEAAAAVRWSTRRAIARHVGRSSARSAAIVTAILIGDRAGLDEQVQRRLQEAGTYHVIAISGGNIAILAGLLLAVARVARLGHRASSSATIAALVAYAGIVGGGASVVRATLMAVAYLLARQWDHRGAPLNALAAAGAVILVATPLAVTDAGFWLTFGATLGILAGMALAGPRLPRAGWLRAPATLFGASLFAELALFPVAALVFARVTFAGLALNFVAIPLMSVAQIAGMAVLPLSAASEGAADVAGLVAHVGAAGLVRSAELVDLAPWLTYRLPPPHWLSVAGYYAGWAAWVAARALNASDPRGAAGRARARTASTALVAACGLWILVEPATLVAPGVSGRLRLVVLDVGHGDSVLVQLPDRRTVLVDTGGSLGGSSFDIGGRVVAPALWALGTRRIDLLVLTHGDPDHIGGGISVVRDFRPREVWVGVPVPRLEALGALRQQALDAGASWRTAWSGTEAVFGAVSLHVRHPPPPDWERQRVRNDDSMVVEIRYGSVSVVLAGDIGREVEPEVGAAIPPARLRILKVPHHGSATSSTAAFLQALRPALAILSAGATTKVSDEVLARCRDAGAVLVRTDAEGAVIVETDGTVAAVTTFAGRRLTVVASPGAGSGQGPG
jgi:competence protein ComEC